VGPEPTPLSEPPSLRALQRAIPARCFAPSTARSLLYLAADGALLAALYALALRVDAWPAQAAIGVAIGTVFFSLKVIGHDCGHGSFSRHPRLNHFVGHLTNTLLLVPYHAWRASHRIHHRHAGDIDRDEGWYPLTASQAAEMPRTARWLRQYGVLLVFPLYLWRRSWGRVGSHFDADGPIFAPSDRRAVRTSIRLCSLWALALLALAIAVGPGAFLRLYAIPYAVFVCWMDLVTYLHHTDPAVPWRRGDAWTFERGALATVDRSYGWLDLLHHHIGTHVVHHLFPGIPHYRLREATAAIRPLLGAHYRRSEEGVARAFARGLRRCHFVPDAGAVVYYAAAPAPPSPTGSGSRPSTRR